MQFLVVIALIGVLGVQGSPEAPAPYAPSGWRPSGPVFELPTEIGSNQPAKEYGPPALKSEIEVTEEELQYTGEIATTEATTSFLEYGAPATESSEEFGSTPSSSSGEYDDFLNVQGLPETLPSAEFRSINSQRFTAGRNQGFQQPAKVRQDSREQFGARLTAPTQNRNVFNQRNQYVRVNPPARQENARLRGVPVFNQRFTGQRQTLDSYGAPAQSYGPPTQETIQEYGTPVQEYGPPTQEYGPPASEAPQEEDVDLPQQEPEESPESESEENSESEDEEEADGEGNIAISNSVATGRYVNGRSGRLLQARGNLRNGKSARLQQVNQPIYTYNQFGQLIRIY